MLQQDLRNQPAVEREKALKSITKGSAHSSKEQLHGWWSSGWRS